jgi:predicted secreted hydrolase
MSTDRAPTTAMTAALHRRGWLQLAGLALAAPATLAGPPAARGLAPRPLVFPRDHGSHDEVRTEWWYLTGHAQPPGAPPLGFQVTFFRSRVDRAAALPGRLAARQLLFAHAAITDVAAGRLVHAQRLARWNGEPPPVDLPAARAVWASAADTAVHLRGWSFVREAADGRYVARVEDRTLAIELSARPTQPLLLQGEQGYSRKGPDPGQASFYVSHPQLAVSATLRVGEGAAPLRAQGWGWLDHEWSEALMHPEAVGWDWTGMNLADGSALTAFRLRRADGSPVWAGGSWRPAGAATPARVFGPEEVRWRPGRTWVSPRTGAAYPVEWHLATPVGAYTVRALLDAQELDDRAGTGAVYWEGLSDLLDAAGRPVGRGYLELTGYARRLVL